VAGRVSVAVAAADEDFGRCAHPDDPVSGAAFSTKTDLNPDGTQRCLSAPQSAG